MNVYYVAKASLLAICLIIAAVLMSMGVNGWGWFVGFAFLMILG